MVLGTVDDEDSSRQARLDASKVVAQPFGSDPADNKSLLCIAEKSLSPISVAFSVSLPYL